MALTPLTLWEASNYTSFTAAVNDLVSKGISGPVQFVVASGTYNEQITIPTIAGVSATDTILFRSASGDSTTVILNFSSTGSGDNFVARFTGASRITFRSLTLRNQGTSFSRCAVLDGGNGYIRFHRCEFVSGVGNTSSTNHVLVWSPNSVNDTYIRLHNNRFVSSGNSIYNAGGTANTSQPGWEVVGNRFDEFHYHGVYLNQCPGAIVHGNTFSNNVASASTSSYSIYLINATGTAKVSNNIIDSRGYTGIYMGSITATSFDPSQVFNNMISINGGSAIGIYLSGGSNVNAYHNSVNLYNTGSGTYGVYTSGGSAFQFRNNIIANQGLGYAMYIGTTSAITASNYNNLYTNGCYLGYWGSARVGLQEWQAGSGFDQNSLSVNPRWNSHTDLRTTYHKMDNAGMNLLASVPLDIDGQPRAATPCLGADEFTGTPVTPVSGIVSIPGTYSTIQAALNAINQNGISGHVEIRIADGTYNEQLRLDNFDRANAGDTLLIRSLNNDSSKVTIQYTASGASDNYVVLLSHAKGVTLRHIGIIAAGTSFSRGVVMAGNVSDIRINRCRFQANPSTSSSPNFTSVYADDISGSNIRIVQNTILSNAFGITVTARSGCNNLTGLEITDNQILDSGYRGIEVGRVTQPIVSRNRIISPTSSSSHFGIYGYTINGQARFERNEVVTLGSYALHLSTATASGLNPGLIANNMFSVSGGSPYAMYLANANFYQVYHNSVLCSGTSTGSIVLYTSGGSGLDIRNNIFANYGTGYAIYIGTTGAISQLDHNIYYTRGCWLGYWGSNRGTLAQWQTGSGRDQNSHQFNPRFVSTSDLHSNFFRLMGLGTNLSAVVPTDFDGDPRPVAPCPGADEFSTTILTPVSGTITVPGQYATLQAAFDVIYEAGISGTVTINIADGTYTGRASLAAFSRTNPTDSLIIQSASRDSSKVTLQYTSSGTSDNYIIYIVSPENVVIRDLGFVMGGTSFARAIVFTEQVNGLSVSNCVFVSNMTSGTSTNGSVIISSNAWGKDITIRHNTFNNGSYGVDITNPGSCQQLENVTIEHNVMNFPLARGIDLLRVTNTFIRNNSIIAPGGSSSLYAIYINSNSGQMEIVSNNVVSSGPVGFYLTSCAGTSLQPLLVANNMISMSGGSSYAVYLGSCSYMKFYHNTMHCFSTNTSSYGIYTSGGSNLDLRNNIMSQAGTGYAWYCGTPAAITTSDYNILRSSGTNLGYWSGNRTDLAAWKAASGKDANSIGTDPQFRSNTNLHIMNATLKGSGTDLLADVPVDIDGNPRANPPFIGADEIRIDFAVTNVLAPVTGCLLNEDITIRVANPGDAQDSVFVLRYQVNNGTIFIDTMHQLLEPQSATNFTFSQKYNFTNPGSYTIRAWISYPGDEGLNNDTTVVTITSHPKPVAGFVGQNGCQGVVLNFTDNSTVSGGSITAWLWNFGDGNSSTLQHPTHTYTSVSGPVNVQLIATTNQGCSDTATNSLTVFAKPAASFTASVACEQTATQFTNTSTVASGAITVYAWSFGGGATSSQQNPSHTYATSGLKSVQLIVTTNTGCKDTVSQNVMVHPKPNADFLVSGDVCLGEAVTFTDVSFIPSGVITGYAWAFGDGGTSTLQNEQRTYATAGTYNVTLTVTSDQQCSHSQTKTVEVFPNPVAAFAPSPACDGRPVVFTNQSTISSGSISQYGWSFGDGNTATSTDPSHTYATAGSYTVTLVAVSDKQCADTTSLSVDISPVPVAAFTAPDVCDGEAVVFTNQSTISGGTISQYGWSFGDGNVGAVASPSHTYAAPGVYTVILAAVSDKQCADTVSAQVEVFALPAKPTLSRSGNTLQAPTGYTYVWLKDNQPISGATSSELTLSGNGAYVVVITDQNGCSNASDPFVITGISTLPDGTTVKVFPNPATDAVWVELNGNYNRQLTVSLFDGTGRLAGMPQYLPAGTGSKVMLPTMHLAAGTYWIRVSDTEGSPLTHLPVVVIR
jgi:PKD repeat protein